MGKEQPEVYQGNDWLTYRWSVAQAFDTLDRVRDVCRHTPEIGLMPQMPGLMPPRYDMPEDDTAEIF
ncbi:MAG TPA: hypothetical protein VFR09_08990, partial [Alphaproteobacteria bacterium]|nr:hypothetical protein [Alphaproteobacteria bacterium]